MRSFTKAAVAAFVFAAPTAPAFAQALPDAKIAVVDSERIFRDWKQDTKGERSPRKIIYRLDHSYSQANLNGSALKGRDAERVALLQPIAKKFGFNLGLAHVKLTLHGLWNPTSTSATALTSALASPWSAWRARPCCASSSSLRTCALRR